MKNNWAYQYKIMPGLYADLFSVEMLMYHPMLKPISPAFFCASLDEFHPSFIPHSVTPFSQLYTSPYRKLSFWKSAIVLWLPNRMLLLLDTSPPFPLFLASPQQCSIPRRCSLLPREGVVWDSLTRFAAHVHCAAVLSPVSLGIPSLVPCISRLIRSEMHGFSWLPVISTQMKDTSYLPFLPGVVLTNGAMMSRVKIQLLPTSYTASETVQKFFLYLITLLQGFPPVRRSSCDSSFSLHDGANSFLLHHKVLKGADSCPTCLVPRPLLVCNMLGPTPEFLSKH